MLFCKISKCLTNIQIWPAQYLIITSISWVHSNFIGLQANLTHLHSSINKNSIKLDYLQDVYYSGLLCYVTSRDVQRIQSKGVDKGSWFQMSWEIYPQLNIYLQTRLIVLNDQSLLQLKSEIFLRPCILYLQEKMCLPVTERYWAALFLQGAKILII